MGSKSAAQERARALLVPTVRLLARLGITPTAVTLAGLALNVVAGITVGAGFPLYAGLILIVAGVCDALDGQLARHSGRTTRFGAFLDSTIDRIDETAVLCGIGAWFLRAGGEYAHALAIATAAALAGSIITSYTRARAEGLGLECKVGLLERTERVALTVAGLLFGPRALVGALLIILVLSWVTVLQRIVHVRNEVRRLEAAGPAPGAPSGPRA